MWTLKPTHHSEEDRGVVLAWVAIMMAVLLGIGALVIDIGALLVERRELQNGADAAALAVAQDCALGDCSRASTLAQQFANLNAKDGVSAVETLCGVGPGLAACPGLPPARASGASGAAGWVRVGTRTETEDGDNQVSFLLAPIMNAATGATWRARAAAAWGPLGAAATLPIAVHECERTEIGLGVLTTIYLKSQGGPSNPGQGNSGGGNPGQGNSGQPPDDEDEEGCAPRSPGGGSAPGNFRWLEVDNRQGCSVTISVGDDGESRFVVGDQGNNNELDTGKNACNESMIRDQTVLVPLYDTVTDQNAQTQYTFVGFAGFHVTAYRFSGSSWSLDGGTFSCPPPPGNVGGTGNLRCIQGYFTTIAADGEFGGPDLGAYAVRMVE